MKRVAAGILVGLTAAAVVTPAHAAPSRNLYMVKDLQYIDGVYYGDFATLAKKGSKVVGAVGAFSSEYTCIRGTVSNGKLRAKIYENGVPIGSFTRKWVGSGSQQRIKGMTSVTYNEASTYLESDPRSFIQDCRSAT